MKTKPNIILPFRHLTGGHARKPLLVHDARVCIAPKASRWVLVIEVDGKLYSDILAGEEPHTCYNLGARRACAALLGVSLESISSKRRAYLKQCEADREAAHLRELEERAKAAGYALVPLADKEST